MLMKTFLLSLALCFHSFHALADSFDAFDGRTWTYYGGYEFPGAEGNIQLSKLDDRDVVILAYDFTIGGAYVAGRVMVEIMESARTFSFAAKADRPLNLTLRVKDSEDQIHTYKPVYEGSGDWQNVSFDLREDATGHFGGSKDGVIHFPIMQVTIGVAKGEATTSPGEVYFAAQKK